jgi:hypothetical protein
MKETGPFPLVSNADICSRIDPVRSWPLSGEISLYSVTGFVSGPVRSASAKQTIDRPDPKQKTRFDEYD